MRTKRLIDATREPDPLCPCKEFREATDGTVCHCGRYLNGDTIVKCCNRDRCASIYEYMEGQKKC